ncbi:hypothetical protein [Pedobacter sp.]|jgi:hypothetical protein|uniref:hypothetical protein n=1 Tax=Pedobacter sp. TaxID=1411316 RepID=UPI002C69EB17|nr:hypothetical protein [Pedobacter sp.]HWW43122.1 hypothetical protein [Pedobacter sp.]
MAKKELDLGVQNRIRQSLEQRNSEDNALKSNLDSPENETKLKLERINYLNSITAKYEGNLQLGEKRWLDHVKINRDATIKDVYNTPLKKIGRFYGKLFPKSVSSKLWSNVTKWAGNLRDTVKDKVKNGIQSLSTVGEKAREGASNAISGLRNSIPNHLDKIKNALVAGGAKVFDFLERAFNNMNYSNVPQEGKQIRGQVAIYPPSDSKPSLLNKMVERIAERAQSQKRASWQTFSYDQLKNFLTQKGYGEAIPGLHRAITNGQESFQLQCPGQGDSSTSHDLNFSKNRDGKIQFNSIVTKIKNEDRPGEFKELKVHVNGARTPSSTESIKLLAGETICRHELNKNGELVKNLYSLNEFDMKHDPKNVRIDSYTADPEHVRRVVEALPHPPGTTREYKEKLIDSLTSGEKPLVPLQENGTKTNVYMKVGTVPGLMKYSDINNKSMQYSDVRKIMNPSKKVSEKVNQKKEGKRYAKKAQVRH